MLVGGVNSPVRSFAAVGGEQVLVDSARGAWIIDVDGREYVDLVGSWGTAIVGHAHPSVVEAVVRSASTGLSFGATCEAEIDLAELILPALPSCEMIRFVNSGTEAVMSAIRLARAATGRSKVLKFEGCYHGHADALLVKAGSGAAHETLPASAGLPAQVADLTLLAPFNDLDAVEQVVDEHGGELAAILLEPIAGNMGLIPPVDGFLQYLRRLCDRCGALLIYDEVMSGFRVAWGGYQSFPHCAAAQPDLTTLGKVIGGGMPVAAYAARRELMELVAPVGPMYQAGTLSGNPVGMAAGLATLRLCQNEQFYERLEEGALALADGLREAASGCGIAVQTLAVGGMLGLFFSAKPVSNFADAKACDLESFKRFFHAMLKRGVWLPPSPFEAMFISAAHGEREIEHVLRAAREAFREIAP